VKRDNQIRIGNNDSFRNFTDPDTTPFNHYSTQHFQRPRNFRMMSLNVLEGLFWRKNPNLKENIKKYFKWLNIDMLCTQEDSSPTELILLELLGTDFMSCKCSADRGYVSNLSNNIYFRGDDEQWMVPTKIIPGALERCAVIKKCDVLGHITIVVNVHLEVNDAIMRNTHILAILTYLKAAMYPVIIVGDFNDYDPNDFYDEGGPPSHLPTMSTYRAAKGAYYTPPSNVFDSLRKFGYTDAVVRTCKIAHGADYKKYIPTNTSIYGGRVDHVWVSEIFLENFEIFVTPMSPFMGDQTDPISDHLPYIIDILS